MIAVKLPSFIHGVHTINLHNSVNKPFVPSYLPACSSAIRVFFSSSAVAEPAGTRISAAAKGRRGRKSSGGDVNGLKRENGSGFVEEGEREDRNVRCEVDVISWRERRIKGEIWVNADPQSVWDALTDYERLADFIPISALRSIGLQIGNFPLRYLGIPLSFGRLSSEDCQPLLQ